MLTKRLVLPVALAFVYWLSLAPDAIATKRDLRQRWHGAWVLTDIAVTSDCGANYTNNDVRGRLVSGGGAYRFEAGELANVHKVNLKRRQVDVLIDLAVPFLAARQEGPFTLYDELGCKVELEIRLPEGVKSSDTDRVDAVILDLLERYETLGAAESSVAWNRREVAPYPPRYDRTLAEYEVWKVGRINASVQSRIEESLDRAGRIIDGVDGDDPDYTAGFGAGLEEASRAYLTSDCNRLLDLSEGSFVESPPSDESAKWRSGYRDGQRLAFSIQLGRKMTSCFLPPSPLRQSRRD